MNEEADLALQGKWSSLTQGRSSSPGEGIHGSGLSGCLKSTTAILIQPRESLWIVKNSPKPPGWWTHSEIQLVWKDLRRSGTFSLRSPSPDIPAMDETSEPGSSCRIHCTIKQVVELEERAGKTLVLFNTFKPLPAEHWCETTMICTNRGKLISQT